MKYLVLLILAATCRADQLPVIDFSQMDALSSTGWSPADAPNYRIYYVPSVQLSRSRGSVQISFDGSIEVVAGHETSQPSPVPVIQPSNAPAPRILPVAPIALVVMKRTAPDFTGVSFVLADFAFGGDMATTGAVNPSLTRQFYLPNFENSAGQPIVSAEGHDDTEMPMVGCDVVSNPEPRSFALLALPACVMFFWRKRSCGGC